MILISRVQIEKNLPNVATKRSASLSRKTMLAEIIRNKKDANRLAAGVSVPEPKVRPAFFFYKKKPEEREKRREIHDFFSSPSALSRAYVRAHLTSRDTLVPVFESYRGTLLLRREVRTFDILLSSFHPRLSSHFSPTPFCRSVLSGKTESERFDRGLRWKFCIFLLDRSTEYNQYLSPLRLVHRDGDISI
jgi:hypothetical protein